MAFKTKSARNAYERAYIRLPAVKARRKECFDKWKKNNKGRLLATEAKRRLEKRAMCLVATVRIRARKRSITFDLDEHVPELQERINAGRCELTGVPFDLAPGRKYNSPSLDRINPKGGYVYDNVRVVLNCVNAALGDWGEDILRSVMEAWLR
jgi:hypothetical protein